MKIGEFLTRRRQSDAPSTDERDHRVVREAEGPGRWRFRRSRNQTKFRAKRRDGSPYTKPTIAARAAKRRARKKAARR